MDLAAAFPAGWRPGHEHAWQCVGALKKLFYQAGPDAEGAPAVLDEEANSLWRASSARFREAAEAAATESLRRVDEAPHGCPIMLTGWRPEHEQIREFVLAGGMENEGVSGLLKVVDSFDSVG